MRRIAVTALTAALAVAGCARGGEDRVDIVATPWPLVWLAAQVAPEAAVHELTVAGQDAHDLELGPRDRSLLAEADVVLHIGVDGYQPQVEHALAERAAGVVSAAEAGAAHRVELLGRIEELESDPHLWFEPLILADTALALAEALAQADPGGAGGYRERAAALGERLRGLRDELRTTLASCEHRLALVSHGAYGYLLPSMLRQVGITGVSGHDEVTAARLAELVALARDEGLDAVLAEQGESRAPAEALAREAGLRLVDVDPLESPPEQARARGLPALLREQAAAFAQVLECAP